MAESKIKTIGSLSPADQVVLARACADPVWFAENILGHTVWSLPKLLMKALARPRARVAVKACHASSKTFTAAEMSLWFVMNGGTVITTAPGWVQVKSQLWREIRLMHASVKWPAGLGGRLLQTEYHLDKTREFGDDPFMIGISTDEGVRFQGFHGRILIVIDEATGVSEEIWSAIEGIRAGGDVRILALGNPWETAGSFYEAFASGADTWSTFTIDAFDTPNLHNPATDAPYTLQELLALPRHELHKDPVPYLVKKAFVVEKFKEWGENDARWQSKVRGQFPDEGDDTLLPLGRLELCQREPDRSRHDKDALWWAGVDVAGPGDAETVVAIRKGETLRALVGIPDADARGKVIAALEPYRDLLTRGPQRQAIKVDTAGAGWYLYQHLLDAGYRGYTGAVNVGGAPGGYLDPKLDKDKIADLKARYVNLKAELYDQLRTKVYGRIPMPILTSHPMARKHLVSLHFGITSSGKMEIETKEEMAKKGNPSPDYAEAIMLCYADIRAPQHYYGLIAARKVKDSRMSPSRRHKQRAGR